MECKLKLVWFRSNFIITDENIIMLLNHKADKFIRKLILGTTLKNNRINTNSIPITNLLNFKNNEKT
jgi:hypothetical protein